MCLFIVTKRKRKRKRNSKEKKSKKIDKRKRKMLVSKCSITTQPTASFTSTLNNTAKQIEKADHTEQEALRKSAKSLILSYFLFLIVLGSKT